MTHYFKYILKYFEETMKLFPARSTQKAQTATNALYEEREIV